MANFPRVWPAPGLTFNGVPGSANLTALDINVSRAINGDGGSTHSPVTPIVLGGAGLEVTGPATLDDIQASTLNGVLTVNQPIVPTGVDGFVAPKLEVLGSLAGAVVLSETYDTHSFGNTTAAVTASVPFAGGGQPRRKRIYHRSTNLSFEIVIQTVAPLANQASFPPGSSKAWVELIYTGLGWEVAGYGGGTTV